MKKFYFFLSMVIAAMTASAATITDAITPADFKQGTTTSYEDLGEFTASKSGNTYQAYAAIQQSTSGSDNVFVVRSAGSVNGFVVTDAKAGPVRKVYFSWPGTVAGSQMKLYGSDEPFTIADMYNEEGVTFLGSAEKPANNDSSFGTIDVPEEYNFKYVGLVPVTSGFFGVYLKVIYFDYDEPVVEPTTATVTAIAGPDVRRYVVMDYDDSSAPTIIVGEANSSKSAEYTIGHTIYVKVFANEYDGALLSKVTVNGEEIPAAVGKEDYVFTFTLEEDTEIYAEGEIAAPSEYTVNVAVEGNGGVTILDSEYTPIFDNTFNVAAGTSLMIAPVADNGNVIESFTINGVEAVDENGETGAGKGSIMVNYTVEGDTDVNVTFKVDEAGVSFIGADEAVAPVYYNLQGLRVDAPTTGVYIKVTPTSAEKVYLSK